MWKAFALSAAMLAATPALAQDQLFAENIQQVETFELDALRDAIGKTAAITTISPVGPNGQTLRESGSGSAFFMREGGQVYLWTNNHVVTDSTYVRYQMCDETGFEFQVPMSEFWRDQNRDFASLTLPRFMSDLPTFEPADLSRLSEGQAIYLIGGPLGFKCSVSKGVLSYNGRHIPRGEISSALGDYQTDAALNPGNSGGVALVMQDGELKAIGMNTFIISPTGVNIGLGFIQPLDMLQTSHSYMRSHGGRSFVSTIGAAYADLRFDFWQSIAAFDETVRPFLEEGNRAAGIRALQPGGPAATAGLRVGDIVMAVNGTPVENQLMLAFTIANSLPGEPITLDIIRSGQRLTITIEPSFEEASLQTEGSANTVPTFYFGNTGIESIMPADQVLKEYFADHYENLSKAERAEISERWDLENGIVVNQLANMSPAHASGITTFTIVESVQISGEWFQVDSMETFESLLEEQMNQPTAVLVRHLPSRALPKAAPRAEVVMLTPSYVGK